MKMRSFKIACLMAIIMSFTIAANKLPRAGGGSSADAIKAAEAAIDKAKKNKWIWRDTEKMLKKAKEAAKKGDAKKATTLANAAKDQAELAVKQFNFEKGKDRSLKGS